MNHTGIDNFMTSLNPFLTEKEKEFLSSARGYAAKRGQVTPSQLNWIKAIEEKYSPGHIKARQQWRDSWNQEHRRIAKMVSEYYKNNPPYFSNYVSMIDRDPEEFFLTEKQWNKFCENKYALKIRKEYDSEPKFKIGDCIQIRENNRALKSIYNENLNFRSARSISGKVGFVVEASAKPIIRAAKGSRIYKILLVGGANTLYVHESDIKKNRSSKK